MERSRSGQPLLIWCRLWAIVGVLPVEIHGAKHGKMCIPKELRLSTVGFALGGTAQAGK